MTRDELLAAVRTWGDMLIGDLRKEARASSDKTRGDCLFQLVSENLEDPLVSEPPVTVVEQPIPFAPQTYQEAVELAERSVYVTVQLTPIDPSTVEPIDLWVQRGVSVFSPYQDKYTIDGAVAHYGGSPRV
jgi:hypothetical protein